MKLIIGLFASIVVAAIAVLSVVPPSARPVLGSHNLEHFSVFGILGIATGLALRSRPRSAAPALIGFCALIEIIQIWVPGRHARLEDFLVDAGGCLIGLGLVHAEQMLSRMVPAPQHDTASFTPAEQVDSTACLERGSDERRGEASRILGLTST